VRQPCEPFAEKSLDLLFIKSLREALRRRRVRATQEPVVERFEFDAARGQLPVEILVSVDAELARIGKVGAELDEEGSEVFVHAVKIIVLNHGRGVVDPRDGALALPEAFADGARHASLARQDSKAALRIARLLENAGLSVWFDVSNLDVGDSLILQVRRAIDACNLFVSIISQATEADSQGFFRRERYLASERLSSMPRDVPFYLPVVIDDVAFPHDEPLSLRDIEILRAPEGHMDELHVERVVTLCREAQRFRNVGSRS
jgi:hypothetical protein